MKQLKVHYSKLECNSVPGAKAYSIGTKAVHEYLAKLIIGLREKETCLLPESHLLMWICQC